MVGVLIRTKLTIMRNARSADRSGMVATGTVLGAVLAASTIAIATLSFPHPRVGLDLLAAVFAVWALGWIVGPVLSRGAQVLRVDQFRLLPVPRFRLALGLLGAAFVGLTTAVTLLAFLSLIVYAVRLGPLPAVLAVLALPLQLALVVLLSRVAAGVFASALGSRLGASVAAVVIAVMLVLSQSGWIVYVAIEVSGVYETGFPGWFSGAVRSLPSSWGLVAVDAADRSRWLLALAATAGLALVDLLLVAVWSRQLALPRRTGRAVVRGSARPARPPARGPVATVAVKELRTWRRSPAGLLGVLVAVSWALLTGLLPLLLGSPHFLPWVGLGIALMATVGTVNLYGQDGTALWLTMQVPGSERADVRGRQLAWLVTYGPLTLVATVGLTAASGLAWAWPWVLALLPALVGGGAGLMIWASVAALAPAPDPHKRRDSPLEAGDSSGMAFAMFWLALLPAVPPAVAVGLGGWAGVPVGVATGVLLAWWLGRVAHRRLAARAPELLARMRAGRTVAAEPSDKPDPFAAMSQRDRTIVTACLSLAWLPLFPQGIVPMIFKFVGTDAKVWFLALYLPGPWQWPVIIAMVTIGLLGYWWPWRIHRRYRTG